MRTFFSLLVLFLPIGIYSNAFANVVMTGTRVIFLGDSKEKTIQLRNNDDQPYIVNIQVDDGQGSDNNSMFIPTPQIFRMEPSSGQSVRLIYTGEHLPQDRESIFWFSFSQLPYQKNNEKGQNQLILALTNRVKIFYRPRNIVGKSSEIAQNLKFQVKKNCIEVTNPGGYYAVIRNAELVNRGKKTPLAYSMMIAPQSKVEWPLHSSAHALNGAGARIHLVTVNDYGVDVDSDHAL